MAAGVLHAECARAFRIGKSATDHSGKPLLLHTHQREAILKAKAGKSYVLTSGTGSGKSLAYIVPIVDHVLHNGSGRGIQAIVVYPMNALANSQDEELKKFLESGYLDGKSPVRFARYTGQEKGLEKDAIRSNPPDILLTNYMMLELLLTRSEDRELIRAAQGLRYLVFDELHTYRGRQGADVALLIRRCRQAFGGHDIICVGTSATMASGGTTDEQKRDVAAVAQTLFGVPFDSSQVIGETLERATPEVDCAGPGVVQALRMTIEADTPPPVVYDDFCVHPLASWIESTIEVQGRPAPAVTFARYRGDCRARSFRTKSARRRASPRSRQPVPRVVRKCCANSFFRVPMKACAGVRRAGFRSLPSGCTNSSRVATRSGRRSNQRPRVTWKCPRRARNPASRTSRSFPWFSAANAEPPTIG
ncbi:MAG: DEAD/DEAH box helicase [Verrucomicrobia bacterium]|nr:DEAD/DEAH box helicase [Verrucomicrobiota bacterium]